MKIIKTKVVIPTEDMKKAAAVLGVPLYQNTIVDGKFVTAAGSKPVNGDVDYLPLAEAKKCFSEKEILACCGLLCGYTNADVPEFEGVGEYENIVYLLTLQNVNFAEEAYEVFSRVFDRPRDAVGEFRAYTSLLRSDDRFKKAEIALYAKEDGAIIPSDEETGIGEFAELALANLGNVALVAKNNENDFFKITLEEILVSEGVM